MDQLSILLLVIHSMPDIHLEGPWAYLEKTDLPSPSPLGPCCGSFFLPFFLSSSFNQLLCIHHCPNHTIVPILAQSRARTAALHMAHGVYL